MFPRLAAVCVSLLVVTGCELPGRGSATATSARPWAPAPVSAPPTWNTGGPDAVEVQVLDEVNARRQRGAVCGNRAFSPAAPLQLQPQLTQAARAHSADMAARDFFDHTSPDGRTMTDRVRAAGFQGNAIGENIAAGRPTPRATVDEWMQSPGHCANIMDADFHFLGVGHAQRPGTTYTHYWTQDFGS